MIWSLPFHLITRWARAQMKCPASNHETDTNAQQTETNAKQKHIIVILCNYIETCRQRGWVLQITFLAHRPQKHVRYVFREQDCYAVASLNKMYSEDLNACRELEGYCRLLYWILVQFTVAESTSIVHGWRNLYRAAGQWIMGRQYTMSHNCHFGKET